MKVTAIIQARMGASRLSGKIMMKIKGKPMLWYSVKRTKQAPSVNNVIVATSTEKKDDIVFRFCKKNNIEFYRGSETDVLDRYYKAARQSNSNVIVRITADCPLIDPNIIEMLVQKFLKSKFDYIRTGKTWPNGIGSVEVFDFKTLEYVWKHAKGPGEREHVTPYIYSHPKKFKIKVIEYEKDCEHIVLSVDFIQQFNSVKKIIEDLYPKNNNFGIDEILDYLDKNPHILKSIKVLERRGPEQYLRSIKNKSR